MKTLSEKMSINRLGFLLKTHANPNIANKTFIVNEKVDSLLKTILITLDAKGEDDAEEIVRAIANTMKDTYVELLNNLHKFSDNIPELLGDETPDTFIKYLKEFSEEEIKNIIDN